MEALISECVTLEAISVGKRNLVTLEANELILYLYTYTHWVTALLQSWPQIIVILQIIGCF